MLSINYDITIGSTQFKPADNSRLIELRCEAAMDIPVNSCRMHFTVPSDLSFAAGDEVTVKLGYKDEGLSTIFTGLAGTVEWQVGQVVIEAESLGRQLAGLCVNEYFENAFAGDVVQGLVGETDMATGRVEPGLRFSFYAVGSNRSAWEHLRELAAHCGFDLYADAEDKLVFGRSLPGVPELFSFGTNIVSLRAGQAQIVVEGVEVFGESPASFGGGPDAAQWFTKNEVKGSSGSGRKMRVYAPAARTQETAAQIAEGIWSKISPRKTARLRTLGKAGVVLGSLVMVSGMPADSQNGTYKVRGIVHNLKQDKGFISDFQLEEV